MPDDLGGGVPEGPPIRPLSRRATRLLVVACVLLAFLLAYLSASYLLRSAEESARDGLPEDRGVPADTTGALHLTP